MKHRRLVGSSLRTMGRYRLRTFFMGLGVVIGVAALVAGRSLGTGAEKQFAEKVNRVFGPGTILIFARNAEMGPQSGPVTSLKLADMEAMEAEIDQVVAWDAVLAAVCNVQYRGENRQLTVYGHSERAGRVWSRDVIEGRFLNAEDWQSAARVALLGTSIATSLFGDASPVGEEILLDSAPYRVVGLLEPIGIDPHGEDRDMDVMVPTTTVMRRIRNVNYVGSAKVVVKEPELVDDVAAQIEELLRERHAIVPGQSDDFVTYTSKFAGRSARRAGKVLRIYFPAAAGIILLVAAIVISNVMLSSVRQRIGEIGLRKAVGASEMQISMQFFVEALGITLGSGLLGLLLGAGIVTVASRRMELPAAVSAESLAMGFAAAAVVGVFSGLAPARRAAKLDPVEALR